MRAEAPLVRARGSCLERRLRGSTAEAHAHAGNVTAMRTIAPAAPRDETPLAHLAQALPRRNDGLARRLRFFLRMDRVLRERQPMTACMERFSANRLAMMHEGEALFLDQDRHGG